MPCRFGRQAAGARTTDEQVTAEVEIERRQGGIVGALRKRPAARRLATRCDGRGQVSSNAVEVLLVICFLCSAQRVERFLRRLVEIFPRSRNRIRQLPRREASKIRCRSQKQHDLVSLLDDQRVPFGLTVPLRTSARSARRRLHPCRRDRR